jgi:Flp pilus assembly protein TadG
MTNNQAASKIAGLGGLIRRFNSDLRGNVAMMFGLAAVPLLLGAGIAVDYARSSQSESQLQAAIDSAALAVAASDIADLTGLSESEIEARKAELKELAQSYVYANYEAAGGDTSDIEVSISVEQGIIKVDGKHKLNTTLMNVAGIEKVALGAHAEVNMEEGAIAGVELAMVMDTTGSMADNNKLRDAKIAAKDLVDIIFGDKDENENVKMALIPFSTAVNVGTANKSAAWLDTTGKAEYSKLNFTSTSYHNMKAWNDLNSTPWTGCVEARKGSYDTDDTTPDVGTPDTLFTPYFAPAEPTKTGLSSVSSTILSTIFGSYNGPNDWIATSAQIKSMTVKSSTTLLQIQKNQAKYAGFKPSASSSMGPWQGCKGIQPIVPLTSQRKPLKTAIDGFVAEGYTHIPQGVAWGWRVLSPDAPFTEGAPYNDKFWHKVMVVMTDGDNTIPTTSDSINKSSYSAYGYVAQGRLGSTSASTALSNMNTRLTTTCANAKNKGIEIYTIAFGPASDISNATRNLLRNCASSPEKYLEAPDGATLREHFKAIGASLRKMYLSK